MPCGKVELFVGECRVSEVTACDSIWQVMLCAEYQSGRIRVISPPSNAVVTLGSDISLDCIVDNLAVGDSLSWWHHSAAHPGYWNRQACEQLFPCCFHVPCFHVDHITF